MPRIGIVGLSLVLGLCVTWSLDVTAQRARSAYRVGVLDAGSKSKNTDTVERLGRELRKIHRADGRAFTFEQRWAEHDPERLPALAAELAALDVDVLVVSGDAPAVKAAMGATRTIPIVFLWVFDPVGQGLVRSLGRPGGNVTGLTFAGPELELKRLELLKQTVPSMTRVAVITNGATPDLAEPLQAMKARSASLGVQLTVFDIRRASDLAEAFDRMVAGAIQGIIVQDDLLLNGLVEAVDSPLAAFAVKHRLPMAAAGMASGVLVTYAFSWDVQFRQAAKQIDAILKGATPGSLPVEQPTHFKLIVNLKIAKALGITIPPALLVRADDVVQ